MKLAAASLIICSSAMCTMAAAQSLDWVVQFGSSADEGDFLKIAPDGAGGIVAASSTTGDMVPGGLIGAGDAWIGRFGEHGAPQWIYQFGTADWDRALTVAPDGAGGVFVGGYTLGGLYAPPGGGRDAFVARYDATGALVWGDQIGGAEWETTRFIQSDDAGGVLVSGGMGSPQNIWLARYDAAGKQLWSRLFGTIEHDDGGPMALDGVGGFFVAGNTAGSLAGSAGGVDVWLARFDGDGNRLWITQLGSSGEDRCTGAAPDGAGGVYIGGFTKGAMAGPRTGTADAWLTRYDADGNRLWIRQFGRAGAETWGQGLAADGAGGVYQTGPTDGDVFGQSFGSRDGWIARYDASGNQEWGAQFGTADWDWAYAAATDTKGGAFVGGYTRGAFGGPALGGQDVFIAHYAAAAGCYADCDGSGTLDFFDFLCFQNLFGAGDPGADCDGNGVLDFFDFLCFQNEFAAGCP